MQLTPLEMLVTLSTVLELNPIFQAIKCIRMKSAKDISPITFGMIMTIGALWLFYGYTIHSVPLIVSNVLKLASATVVLVVYARYKER